MHEVNFNIQVYFVLQSMHMYRRTYTNTHFHCVKGHLGRGIVLSTVSWPEYSLKILKNTTEVKKGPEKGNKMIKDFENCFCTVLVTVN